MNTMETHGRLVGAAAAADRCACVYVYSWSGLDLLAEDVTSVTDTDLEGEKSHALRFAVAQCRVVNPNVAPVTVVVCGIWDAEKYGSLLLDTIDTTSFCHSRCCTHIFERVMTNASCAKAVQKTIGTLERMVQNARVLRRKASVKEHRMRGVFWIKRQRSGRNPWTCWQPWTRTGAGAWWTS